MRRRRFLTGLAASTAVLSGCSTDAPTANPTFPEVFNPTGQAVIRPIDQPLVQHGLTAASEQYLYGRLFYPGDAAPVAGDANATWLAETIDELSGERFAVLTNLRTSGAAPAHFWPEPAGATWSDEGLRIQLERQTISTTVESDEAVGVALTVYQYTGDQPSDVTLVFPSGATLSVGL